MEGWTLAAVLAMAAATYLTRAGGYWLFRVVRPSPAVRGMLGYIPGALFVSFTVPALASGGAQAWAGAAGTLAVMLATKRLELAIVGGVGGAWLVWAAG